MKSVHTLVRARVADRTRRWGQGLAALALLALASTVAFAQNGPSAVNDGKQAAAKVSSAKAVSTKAGSATEDTGQVGNAAHAGRQAVMDLATLYVVGYAHLDTEWRWEYPQVINEFLANTLHDNFKLIEKYPHYIFNFSGANRYRFFKEYYPEDYAKLKKYVAEGRWFPAGSSMEESDVNSPSAESIFRQVLYGNDFFRREFGKASAEYMLPDCFGFPSSLPSILAHAGIKGFSTQKLTWGSSAPGGPGVSPEDMPVGIPFNVGTWIGPDGHSVIAALKPGSYGGNVTTDLTSDPDWVNRVNLDGKVTGVFADYHYYGTGDAGGAPEENSVKALEAIVRQRIRCVPAAAPARRTFLAVSRASRQIQSTARTSRRGLLARHFFQSGSNVFRHQPARSRSLRNLSGRVRVDQPLRWLSFL